MLSDLLLRIARIFQVTKPGWKVEELSDKSNRLFIWEFSGWTEAEVADFYDAHEELFHRTNSQHIFITRGEVDVHEIVAENGNATMLRDDLFERMVQ